MYSTSQKFGHTYSFKGFSLFFTILYIVECLYTWNAFPTVLKEFPHMLGTCWLLFLHSVVQLIPNDLNCCWGRVIVEAALHHSPSWPNSPYTAWRCVLSLSSLKTNDSPTKRKPDGMLYRCRMLWLPCWLSVPWFLNKSLSVTSKAPPHHLLHVSRWEAHMRRSSIDLLCISQTRWL